MKYRIVPTREIHIKSLHKALDRVAREKKYLAFLKAPPLAESRKYVRGNIKDRNPQFVALAGEEVIGWCDITRIPRDTSRHCGVLGIALVPEFRGHGIGARLMQKAIAAAWARKFTRIELTVRENNRNAIALYGRLGFKIEGVRRNAFLVDGNYENVLAMALLRDGTQ